MYHIPQNNATPIKYPLQTLQVEETTKYTKYTKKALRVALPAWGIWDGAPRRGGGAMQPHPYPSCRRVRCHPASSATPYSPTNPQMRSIVIHSEPCERNPQGEARNPLRRSRTLTLLQREE